MTNSIVDGERVAARSCHLEGEIPTLRTALEESDVESASDSVVRLGSSPGEIVFDGCELNGGIDLGEGETIDVLDPAQWDMRDCDELGSVTGMLPISVVFGTTATRKRSQSNSL